MPGVDGQSFDDIEKLGRDQWLTNWRKNSETRRISPGGPARVHPKGDGKQRPLGIPHIKDRVVQTATMLVLEPIFEADLEPEQHAYRPERSRLDAVRQVERLLRTGHTEVVDADLSGYFDSIPHAELMKSVSWRISVRPRFRCQDGGRQADRGAGHRRCALRLGARPGSADRPGGGRAAREPAEILPLGLCQEEPVRWI